MRNISTHIKGFTLVESMVAMSILAVAVTGPLIIAQKGIQSAVYSRDQITAFYLAQEAVEYIRNVRDSNRMAVPPVASWLVQFDNCKNNGSNPERACQIDARYTDYGNPNAIKDCAQRDAVTGFCTIPLGFDVKGFYGYEVGSTPTKFTRTVRIDDRTLPGKEAEISVTISWKTNLFSPIRSFTIKEYVFNY